MNFVLTPNLPKGRVSAVIAAPFKALCNADLKIIIPTYPMSTLPEPLKFHADLQIHHFGGRDILCAPECFPYYEEKLTPLGFHVIKGNTNPSCNYPFDAAYNIARLKDIVIHNTKYTDPAVLNRYSKTGLRMLYVSQGYAKCAVCIAAENAIITADAGIARAAAGAGVKTLLISPGGIGLPGYSYGFIGGATGLLSPKTLAVTGSLAHHPDRERILSFLSDLGVGVLELAPETPLDIGTIIPILEEGEP